MTKMKHYELDDRQIRLIIESLRTNEKNSRTGFAAWLARNTDLIETAEWDQKVARAKAVFMELVALRAVFGDDGPVRSGSKERQQTDPGDTPTKGH